MNDDTLFQNQSATNPDSGRLSSADGPMPNSPTMPDLADKSLTLAQGTGLLAELSEALRDMQRATARAVDLVGKVQRAGVVEVIEGLPLELLLALEHRIVSCD
ncbi:MAG: hypothetical protein ABR592_04465, partial [Nitriliruptorales bacterium]